MLCDISKSYDTCILINFEKYLGLGGPAGCSVCIHVRTLSRGGRRNKKGGMVSEKLHRGGHRINCPNFQMSRASVRMDICTVRVVIPNSRVPVLAIGLVRLLNGGQVRSQSFRPFEPSLDGIRNRLVTCWILIFMAAHLRQYQHQKQPAAD